jgi:hypothetical protein
MIRIKLKGLIHSPKGYHSAAYAIIDDVDSHLLQYKWYLQEQVKHKKRYAFRSKWNPITKRSDTLMLHREVMKLAKGNKLQVDHLNHNGLDNRRCNLEIVMQGKNILHSRNKRKGYYYCKGAYVVQLKVNGKHLNIGRFKTESAARFAYLSARKKANKEYILKYS